MKLSINALKILAIFLTLALCITLVPGEVEEVQAQNSEKPTLKFITGSWVPDVLEPFFQEFEEETGIKIKYEAYPFAELFETIEIRQEAKSKDVDVILVDAPVTPAYAVKDYIKPLDKYFTEDEIEETWAESATRAGYWNDTFWSAPLNNSSQVLYYNKDLLEKAGVEFPPADVDKRWTWDQLVDAAKKVDDLGKDIWGFAFDQINRYYQLQPLPESLGGGPGLTEEGTKADITNEAWIKAFTWYGNLFNKWDISPKGPGPEEISEYFAAGNIGLFVGGLWNIPTFEDAEIDFAVAPHPYFEEGDPITPTNSWHVGIWNYTQHEDAAAKFVRYLSTNPEIGIEWLEGHGQFPARKAALNYIEGQDKYNEQPLIAYQIGRYEVANTAVVRAKTPGFYEFERNLNDAFEDIRLGADPEQALEKAAMKINRQLRRYR